MSKVTLAVAVLALAAEIQCVLLLYDDKGPKDAYKIVRVVADLKCTDQPCTLPLRKETSFTLTFEARKTGAKDTKSVVYLDIFGARKMVDVKPVNCPTGVCPIQPSETKNYPIKVNPNFHSDPMKVLLHWELYNEKNQILLHIAIPFIISGNFHNLQTVILHGMLISGAGPPLELRQMCPNIKELHLGRTLLSNWQTIYEIVDQLKYLTVLNISSNRLRIVDGLKAEAFSSLKHLIMGNLNYSWDEILECFSFILNAETVQVPFNNMKVLREPPGYIFTCLASLDLEGNQLGSWDEVNKLGNLSTLRSLNLRNCGLKEIHFPSCDDSRFSTSLFVNLESLVLNNNLFDDFVHLSELDKLQSLVVLKFKDNPVLENEKMETYHQIIITRIRKLEKINGATILPEDRRGSEVDYLKHYGLEWLAIKNEEERTEFLKRHPCYLRLIQKYGPPDINELRKPKTSLKSQLIQIEIFSPDHQDKSYLKKVPYNMSIQKLTGLTQRLFNTGCEIPRLSCIRSEGPNVFELPIDNDLKQLDFYSIRNGDKISVRW